MRRQGIDRRKDGSVAHVETAPGNVIVIPTWMLDPIACAGMEIGEPQVSLKALIDLAVLLTAQGARKSSTIARAFVEEVPHEDAEAKPARGPAPDDHGIRLRQDTRDEPEPKGSRADGAGHAADGGGLRRGEGGTE